MRSHERKPVNGCPHAGTWFPTMSCNRPPPNRRVRAHSKDGRSGTELNQASCGRPSSRPRTETRRPAVYATLIFPESGGKSLSETRTVSTPPRDVRVLLPASRFIATVPSDSALDLGAPLRKRLINADGSDIGKSNMIGNSCF